MSPHTQFLELFRVFFGHFLEPVTDDISESDDQPLLPFVLGILFVPGAFFCFYEISRYADIRIQLRLAVQQSATIEGKFFLITFLMVVVGLFMAWRWESLFVDEQDYLIVGPLPVRHDTVFFAKLAALVVSAVAVGVAASVIPFLAYPGMAAVGGVSAKLDYVVHPTILLLSGAFVVLLFLGAQGLLLLLVPYSAARRLGPYVQALVLAALMFMAICAFDSSELVSDFQHNGAGWLVRMPSFWFVGLYQHMLGQSDPLWSQLARTASISLLAALVTAVGTLLITYKRHQKKLIESKPARRSASSWSFFRFAADVFTRSSVQRAGFDFFFLTIGRSQRHRLAMAAILAFAAAISAQGVVSVFGVPQDVQQTLNTLAIPLTFSFFVLASLLWAATIPLGSKPAWIFELALGENYSELVNGSRRAVVVASVLVPLVSACAAFSWKFSLLYAVRYLLMTTFLVLAAALAAGRHIHQLPFSPNMRRFRPPQLAVVLIGAWLLFTAYAYGMARLEMWAAQGLTRTAITSFLLSVVIAALARARIEVIPPEKSQWTKEEGLLLPQLESW